MQNKNSGMTVIKKGKIIMKFKTNFEELKNAINTIGKGVKKNTIITPTVRFEAAGDKLILSSNSGIGVKIEISAVVKEDGVFVSTFSSINIISIRKCTGDVTAESSDSVLVLKYRGGKAKTVLTAVDENLYTAIPEVPEDALSIEIPVTTMKQMVKETLFASETEQSSDLHSVKMDIEDDEDGLIKLKLSACDGKSLAVRTAYAVKKGTYTGSTVLLPEDLKMAMAIIDGNESVTVSIAEKKIFMSAGSVLTVFQEVSKSFPNLALLLNTKACSFSVEVDKAELLEALNCAIYLQNEQKLVNGATTSITFDFKDGQVGVGCAGLTDYSEDLEAKTDGKFPGTVMFNAALLKDIVSIYPSDKVIIGGSDEKSPFWICAGENEEYTYCVLPRFRK